MAVIPSGNGGNDAGNVHVVAPRNVVQHDYIYHGGYWNNYPFAAEEINRRITGRPDQHWRACFRELTDGRRFARALFLNCGDGRFDRSFIEDGMIDSGVGIDISEEMLAQAREAAVGLP